MVVLCLFILKTLNNSYQPPKCELQCIYEHKTSHKYGYICSISQKWIVWVKIIDFALWDIK